MYYYGARYYDPRISIFVSVDPLAEETMEPYHYVSNNPINLIDPTGMGPEDWVYNKKEDSYHNDNKVTKPSDVTDPNLEYVGKSIDDVTAHHEKNNPVMSIFTNPTVGASVNGSWSGEIKETEPTMADNWSKSSNILKKGVYDLANSFYVTAQSMNPFQDRETITNLNNSFANQSERTDAGVEAISTLLPLGPAKAAAGPTKQWIRFGPSYSHNLASKTAFSIRWGASPGNKGKYLKQIPSVRMRKLNQWLRKQKLPGDNWRTKDPGHFHLKK